MKGGVPWRELVELHRQSNNLNEMIYDQWSMYNTSLALLRQVSASKRCLLQYKKSQKLKEKFNQQENWQNFAVSD